MLVVMQSHATEEQVRAVCERIESLGLRAHPIPGSNRTAIGITGNSGAIDIGSLEAMSGVVECIPVSKPYKLVSRDAKEENTVVRIPTPAGEVCIGGAALAVIAGPCAVENREQAMAVAQCVKAAGAHLFRGGAYKPRTSPYSFQGLGEPGLKILAEVRERFGLGIVTEAIDNESIDLVEKYADVILMAAEYILSEGNYQLILCERGVRTFSEHTRNTLDLSIIPAVQSRSHLPILVDPSHGTGRRNKVLPLSRAAIAVGADGLIVEVHHDPDHALSDGAQSIIPEELEQLMKEVRQIASVVHRTLN